MNREDTMTRVAAATLPGASDRITGFLRGVYTWMFVGLGVTAVVALAVASTPAMVMAIASNRLLFFALMIAQLGIVFGLSASVNRIAPATASLLFLVYSALTGVTISFVLLAFTGESVATTFLVTAGMFGAMALYGTTTSRSLVGAGQFFFMGLVGLIIASVVGIFWHSSALQFLISFVGVIVFTGLTAYDAQRLKGMALAIPDGRVGSYTVVGALSLYLNFINLFLSLLRLFGNRRD